MIEDLQVLDFDSEDSSTLEELLNDFGFQTEHSEGQGIDPFLTENQELTVQPAKKKKSSSKKRPSNNPAYMPALRILRSDIRRTYGTMFNNVLNSHDCDFLRSYFTNFAVPQLSTITVNPFKDEPIAFRRVVEDITGIDAIVHHFSVNFMMVPDSIQRMNETKVCQRLHCAGSRVVGNLLLQGTILYQPVQNAHQYNELQAKGDYVPIQLMPLSTPLQLFFNSTLTMNLDENHRIISIQVTVNDYHEQPLRAC